MSRHLSILTRDLKILITLTAIITLTITTLLFLNTASVRAQEDAVWASHDILKIYNHESYLTNHDQVTYDETLYGHHQRSFYIRPENIEVYNAQIYLTSTYPEETFPDRNHHPEAITDYGPLNGGARAVIDYRKLGLGLTAFVKVILEYPQCCSEDFATKCGRSTLL
jgi:hypothetical protein